MIVPWGQVAESGGYDWSFGEGSLSFTDASRVKLLRDHDTSKAVGKALTLESRPDGMYGVFSVARGAAGDELLSLAEDGVIDGFSIGPVMGPSGFDVDKAGVRHVRAARLMEVTATAVPAFDDARVHKVAASADGKGSNMGDTTVTPAADKAPDTAQLEQFKAEVATQFEGLSSALTKGTEEQGKAIAAAFETAFRAVGGGQGESNVARFAVMKEAPIYSFSGDVDAPSLVRDSWDFHTAGDHEAGDRLRKFQVQQADMRRVTFANNTGNSGEVIPPGYRPEMFVPELAMGRPLHNLVSQGTISNKNPFVIPKYASHTGMVGDHTEGTNPTSGTIVFGEQTVSPGAISGSFVATRELIDSSNPAIDQIALSIMREDWARQTEAKLATAIIAAEPTPYDVFATADPIPQLRTALAEYPFERFASPTGAAMSQAATVALATLEDTTGRPILPSVGAQNTVGLGNAVDQQWFVDGLPFVPAYSLLGEAGLPAVKNAEVIILKREDVWAWESPMLTFRFEEKVGPANIELALFGYYGAAVIRTDGLVIFGNDGVV